MAAINHAKSVWILWPAAVPSVLLAHVSIKAILTPSIRAGKAGCSECQFLRASDRDRSVIAGSGAFI